MLHAAQQCVQVIYEESRCLRICHDFKFIRIEKAYIFCTICLFASTKTLCELRLEQATKSVFFFKAISLWQCNGINISTKGLWSVCEHFSGLHTLVYRVALGGVCGSLYETWWKC